MAPLTRIALDPEVMGGKPCILGLRVSVGTIVGLVAAGRIIPAILAAYPDLEEDDIQEALSYTAWRLKDRSSHYQLIRLVVGRCCADAGGSVESFRSAIATSYRRIGAHRSHRNMPRHCCSYRYKHTRL